MKRLIGFCIAFGLFVSTLYAVPMQFESVFHVSLPNQTLRSTSEISVRIYLAGTEDIIWEEVHQNVDISNGRFKLLIGSVDPVNNPLNVDYLTEEYEFSIAMGDNEAFWTFDASTVFALRSEVANKANQVPWSGITDKPSLLVREANTITSEEIQNGTLTNDDISDNARIAFSKLEITSANIIGLGIPDTDTTLQLNAGTGIELLQSGLSVTINVIGGSGGTIGQLNILDGSIINEKLADNAVTAEKIVDRTITPIKLSSAGASSGQILKWNGENWVPTQDLNTSISNFAAIVGVPDDLRDGDNDTLYAAGNGLTLSSENVFSISESIVTDNFNGDVSISGQLHARQFVGDGSLLTGLQQAVIENNAISSSKIVDGAVIGSKIAPNAITSSKIVNNTIELIKLAQQGARTGQTIKWYGGSWIPTNDIDTVDVDFTHLINVPTGLEDGDDNTTYTAGYGLTLAETEFNLNTDVVTQNYAYAVTINNALTARSFSGNGAQITHVTAAAIDPNTISSFNIIDGSITQADLGENSVLTSKLSDSSVTTPKLIDGAVTTAKLEDLSITSAKVGYGAILNSRIATSSIMLNRFHQNSAELGQVIKWNGVEWIPSSSISGQLDSGNIADGSILTTKLAEGAVTTVKLAEDAVTTDKIADGTLQTEDLADNSISTSKLMNQSVTLEKLGASSAETGNLIQYNGEQWVAIDPDGLVTETFIADQSIGTSKLQNNSITTEKIADSAVLLNKLGQNGAAANQVIKWTGTAWEPSTDSNTTYNAGTGLLLSGTTFGIRSSVVTSNYTGDVTISGTLQAAALTGDGSELEHVIAESIQDNTISTVKLQDNAVTTAKLVNSAITDAKIANGTITLSKLGQNSAETGQTVKWNGSAWIPTINFSSIHTTDLDDAAITTDKVANNAITSAKIANGTITNDDIENFGIELIKLHSNSAEIGQTMKWNGSQWVPTASFTSIQTSDIDDLGITSEKLANNAVTSVKIANGTIVNDDLATGSFENITGVGTLTTTLQGTNAIFSGTVTANAFDGDGSRITNVIAAGIENNAITSSKLRNSAVTTEKISDQAITLSKIHPSDAEWGQVIKWDGNEWIASSSITGQLDSGNIADSSISTSKLANNAVTTTKILNGTILTEDLSDSLISTVKLADAAVTNAKILDGTLGLSKLGQNSAATGQTIKWNGTAWVPSNSISIVETDDLADGAVTSAKLANGAITTTKLADEAVTNAKILDGTLGLSKLGQNSATSGQTLKWNGTTWVPTVNFTSIETDDLADEAVTSAKLANGAVITEDIANNAITADKIAANAVTNAKVLDGTLGLSKLGQNSATTGQTLKWSGTAWIPADSLTVVDTDDLADEAVTSDKIADGTITEEDITDNAITTEKLEDGAVTTAKIQDNAITNAKVLNGTLLLEKLASNSAAIGQTIRWNGGAWVPSNSITSVETDDIEDLAITSAKLAANAVTVSKLSNDAVTSAKIANGTILNDDLADGSISNSKIANHTLTLEKLSTADVEEGNIMQYNEGVWEIVDTAGWVQTNTLADNAVTTAKLSNGSVTLAKLNHSDAELGQVIKWNGSEWIPSSSISGQLDAGNIQDGTITTDKLADGSVTSDKIADNAIIASKIPNTSITGAKITDGTLTSGKLAGASVTEAKLADNAVTSAKIANGTIVNDDLNAGAFTNITGVGILSTQLVGLSATFSETVSANAFIGDGSGLENVIALDIVDNAITSAKIANGTILAEDITNNAITTLKIENGTLQGEDIALGAITGDNIDINTLDNTHLTSGTYSKITGVGPLTQILSGTAAEFSGTVTANAFSGDGSSITGVIADGVTNNSITSAKIVDGTIVAEDIANGTLTLAKLGQNSATNGQTIKWNGSGWVATDNITDQFDSGNIVDGAITTDKLANNAVTSGKILNETILTEDLADDAVTSDKIADATIDSNHIVSGAIDTVHLSAGSVTNTKLSVGSYTNIRGLGTLSTQLSGVSATFSDTVTANAFDGDGSRLENVIASDLANGIIMNTHISANAAIAYAKLDLENSITATDLTTGAVTSTKILDDTITDDDLAEGTYTKITGLGTLTTALEGTSAQFSQAVTANAFYGNGSHLTNITATFVTANAIETTQIFNGAIINEDLSTGNFTAITGVGQLVTQLSGVSANFTGAVTANVFSGNATGLRNIPGNHLLDSSVTGDKIVNGTLTGDDIANYSIPMTKLVTGSITDDMVSENANIALTKINTVLPNVNFQNTWAQNNDQNIQTDKLQGRDSDGLSLADENGTALIQLKDDKIGIGRTNPEYDLDITPTANFRNDIIASGNIMVGKEIVFAQNIATLSSGSPSINWKTASKQKRTLTSDVTVTFTDPSSATALTVVLIQDSSGNHDITWPANVLWSGGVAPVLSTDANAIDIVTFYFDGTTYYGSAAFDFQ